MRVAAILLRCPQSLCRDFAFAPPALPRPPEKHTVLSLHEGRSSRFRYLSNVSRETFSPLRTFRFAFPLYPPMFHVKHSALLQRSPNGEESTVGVAAGWGLWIMEANGNALAQWVWQRCLMARRVVRGGDASPRRVAFGGGAALCHVAFGAGHARKDADGTRIGVEEVR